MVELKNLLEYFNQIDAEKARFELAVHGLACTVAFKATAIDLAMRLLRGDRMRGGSNPAAILQMML